MNRMIKIFIFVAVLIAILLLAEFLAILTNLPSEFYLECFCIGHIALNVTDDLLKKDD